MGVSYQGKLFAPVPSAADGSGHLHHLAVRAFSPVFVIPQHIMILNGEAGATLLGRCPAFS
jgi:hypothetical protein